MKGRSTMLRLDNQLCFALYASSRAITAVYRPFLDPLGLTYPQYLVMLVLWETDRQSVRGLGGKLLLDSGTLTPLLKRLEKQGLVRRSRDAADERVVLVSLTAAGKKLKAHAKEVPKNIACAVGFPRDRAIRLRSELREILSKLSSIQSQGGNA
jgi:DNA-binding MarR family transcriptional regulator